MTHIENMPHILQYGITHVNSANANINFIPIGDNSLISNRSSFIIPNGRTLGEYIPFYFGVRMPMLYVVQNGFNGVTPALAENIIYCVSSVEQIIKYNLDFVFTNGHAVDSFSSFYKNTDINDIENIIDKKAIESKYWNDEHDLDKKRRKEAEFLVGNDIPGAAILGYVVFNEKAKNKLIELGIEVKKVIIKADYYF